ncbi:uncharacterized protein AMSG_06521 [Thecamonas trahens ATCC 50062]|uniref:FAD-binding FR-type domain-containing protein n=1 Tax=Thecamonas trahens ATCC 50062 TaxID=461836 RepID=A0A0L0DG60_THETB|nr:hypothetical protein AMSG_06521 [Thecamonas trahens ATCC 50062]KNC51170.1 hypothetical protein AMSG_06521 [Thecamonas trahens ATCC 50062]|eukprot:XP_013756372.1 hypothetical protein AMSG_06521 [Thecamonas trahens ATCC 50062]
MGASIKMDVGVAGLGVVVLWCVLAGVGAIRTKPSSFVRMLNVRRAEVVFGIGVLAYLALFAATATWVGVGDGHKVVSADKSSYLGPFVLGKLAKLCLALMYLPVLRYPGLDRWVAGRVLPFERRLKFHRVFGAVFLTVASAHGAWMAIRTKFGHFSVGGVSLAGAVALGLFAVMGVGALPTIRRHHFGVFRALHWLQVPAVIAALVHVPGIALYLAVPGSLWLALLLARTVRAWRGRRRAKLSVLPGEATEISLMWPHEWAAPRPGSYAFLRVGSVAWAAWHPFSVVDFEPSTRHVRFIVKVVHHTHAQSWTAKLHALAERGASPSIWIDGAYGELSLSHAALAQCSHVVLVAGGVGVTPMASILQHVADTEADSVQRVTFVWTSRSMADVCTPWIGSTLEHAGRVLGPRLTTSFFHSAPPPSRSISSSSSDSASSSSSAIATFEWTPGRPDLDRLLAEVQATGSPARAVLVAVCGPPSLCDAAIAAGTEHGFTVHVETFRF